MPEDLIFYISQYGYLAIFLCIFLQEVGAPTPLPNELILLFTGYLVFTGMLNIMLVIVAVVAGDLLAASILYLVFHFFGNILLNSKSRWIPISQQSIHHQSQKIARLGFKGIVIGRLSPFIRGYVAVICGLLHIAPKRYGATILTTSIIWGVAYITIGYFLGPYWQYVSSHFETCKYILVSIPIGIILWMIIRFVIGLVWNKQATSQSN